MRCAGLLYLTTGQQPYVFYKKRTRNTLKVSVTTLVYSMTNKMQYRFLDYIVEFLFRRIPSFRGFILNTDYKITFDAFFKSKIEHPLSFRIINYLRFNGDLSKLFILKNY